MKMIVNKLKQFYGNLKLLHKFTAVLVLAVSIPALFLGIFIYSKLNDMVISYTIKKEQDVSAKTAPLIEDVVTQIDETYDSITALPYYHTLFYNPIRKSFSDLTQGEEVKEFQDECYKILDDSILTDFHIYLDLPDTTTGLKDFYRSCPIFRPMSQIQGTYWHGIFQGSHISELYCPPFYLGTQESAENGDMAYMKATTIYYKGNSYPCYAALYFSSSSLSNILSNHLNLDGSVSYILNERNSLVASSSPSLSGIYLLDYEMIEEAFMSSNNFMERTILNHKIYASFYSISNTGWFMVTVHPAAPMIRESHRIIFQYTMFYAVFLLFVFITATFMTRSITNRISSVIHQMRQVRSGLPLPMENAEYHDEIGDLVDTYNYMTGKIQKLMQEQQKAADELRSAEFKSLQAQINPHFLYNTMDMINWLAQQGRTDEVQTAVQSLSRFYKLTLSRKKSLSTIAEEEEHISIYIELQNMRFHGNISYVSDLPDEIMEYQIPKLTLQPVIENAILHGILEKQSKSGTIVLTGWMEGDDIVLLISDDGIGMQPEILQNILSEKADHSSKGSNIAIYNTHTRLQILYGKSYGLSYSSEPGKGTEVQIRIAKMPGR